MRNGPLIVANSESHSLYSYVCVCVGGGVCARDNCFRKEPAANDSREMVSIEIEMEY